MKTSKIKLLVTCLMYAGVIASCSENDTQIKPSRTLELNFPSLNKSNERTSDDFKAYTIMVKSTSPLVIESNDLIVVGAINHVTGKKSYVIIQKQEEKATGSAASRIDLEEPSGSISRGYQYDGEDCFIYGTVVVTDSGETYFFPASTTTQLFMNRCGYGNVA